MAGKRWKAVWSAGQGALIHEVAPIGAIVEALVREHHDAVARLT